MNYPENQNYRPLLEKALLQLRNMRSVVDNMQQVQREPIAIIGMGCRFPGGADNPEAYWHLLHDGIDAIKEIPSQRWDVDKYYHSDSEVPGKMYTKYGGFLDQVDQFDAHFFGISPREAVNLDPQQRLLLEVSWEALEHSGIPADKLKGSSTGVFIGLCMDDYSQLGFNSGDRTQIDAYNTLSILRSMAAGRLAYTLGLQGSTMQLDTACSSSLLAVHLACQSLRTGECKMALAGGVNLILSPSASIGLSKLKALSKDGRCKTFDAAADGYSRGEGCGIVILKRLSDAISHGDNILAVIRGSAVNHDGASNGLTAPNGAAQEALLRKALENARLEPHQIQYVEAHGTGTSLGDPIEVLALGNILGENRSQDNPLTIGSVKTQLGHLESAAGIAGLIKVILSLQQAEIPAHLHFNQPNPYIPWGKLPVRVPTSLTTWDAPQRLAGISSFGMSGTNVHLILESAPQVEPKTQPDIERPLHLLSLSAKTEAALINLVEDYHSFLSSRPQTALTDICFTANTGRSHFEHRLAFIAESTTDLQQQISKFINNPSAGITDKSEHQQNQKIAFLFTGQGSQYAGMARELYETQPMFRQIINRCDEILRPYLEQPLLSVLYGSNTNLINDTAYAQPALFAIEYAVFQLWKSWGIEPDMVLGHSLGEYVAACVAGVFSLEDGLKLIAKRARLMQAMPGNGTMVSVFATEAVVSTAIQAFSDRVSIAAINGPESVVISGENQAIDIVVEKLEAKDINTVKLNVSHAFHSALMEPMLGDFEQVLSEVCFATPKIDLVSNVTGELVTTELQNPQYWLDHLRGTVRFAPAMKTLAQQGCQVFLEVGAKSILLGMGRKCVDTNVGMWLSSLHSSQSDWQQMLSTLAQLYIHGKTVNWFAFDSDYSRQRLVLPTYPFQRQRYWVDTSQINIPQSPTLTPSNNQALHPVLGKRLRLPFSPETRFEVEFSANSPAYLNDHKLYGKAIVPAASYVSMILSAVKETFSDESCVIENLLLSHPLICDHDSTQTVQLVLTPQSNQGTGLQIISLQNPTSENHIEAWESHAKAIVNLVTTEINFVNNSINIETLKQQCDQISGTEFYSTFRDRGYHWENSFQWIDTIWLGENQALCQMKQPQLPDKIDNYQLYPGLIDSCLQLLNSWELTKSEQDYMYVPFNIAKLKFYHRPNCDRKLWCHAQKQESDDNSLLGNISLYDESGRLIAEIIGFEARRTRQKTVFQNITKAEHDWLYEIAWENKDVDKNQELIPQEKGSWLIFAQDTGIGAQLARKLQQNGEDYVLVVPGTEYKAFPQQFYINPENPQDFQRLLEEITNNQTALRGIVYLWGLDDTFKTNNQVRNCGSVLHLVQALTKAELSPYPRLWLVTKATQATTASDDLQLTGASLWGLGKVIALEHPELLCTRLDLDAANHNQVQELYEQLLFADTENEIALRQGIRKVARLVRRNYQTNAQQQFKFNSESSYLITGGLGALGLVVARWMIDKGARNLVLTTRRGITNDTQQEILQLEQAGAKVLVVKADVSQVEDVSGILTKIKTSHPPLRGIIHAAGVLDDGLLLQQTWQRFERVMAAKVRGTWNLHHLTQDIPLDFFVCFSSVASLLGSPTQGNYAAANAFMDTLVNYRRNQGKPGLSINWGAWGEVGMAAKLDIRHQQRITASGFSTIAPQQALQILGDLLTQNATQVGVTPVNWTKFLQQFSPGKQPPLVNNFLSQTQAKVKQESSTQHLELLHQLQETIVSERENLLIARIQDEVVKVLQFDSSFRPNPRTGFFDMGMDSLMSMELKNQLEKMLGNSLPSTLTFEYSTIEALAQYLLDKVISLEVVEIEETLEVKPVQDFVDDILQLSEAELSNLIDQELAELLRV
ncbi:type I polyketide synthase [Plectonema cf. radiosum LEGE 06105]|uniref:Type I polyketide synthase n=1 Tax=Plectonema cf. radiosum LEGE 06105 TaxID=945769 RepID=A0A8J7F616_9CYAN|nr:type I polyketide synthase [Plectonema radiosum]MBE9214580.1 type I polyketide synthase [Plectonema cf. radiosum LEGE 06105]